MQSPSFLLDVGSHSLSGQSFRLIVNVGVALIGTMTVNGFKVQVCACLSCLHSTLALTHKAHTCTSSSSSTSCTSKSSTTASSS